MNFLWPTLMWHLPDPGDDSWDGIGSALQGIRLLERRQLIQGNQRTWWSACKLISKSTGVFSKGLEQKSGARCSSHAWTRQIRQWLFRMYLEMNSLHRRYWYLECMYQLSFGWLAMWVPALRFAKMETIEHINMHCLLLLHQSPVKIM